MTVGMDQPAEQLVSGVRNVLLDPLGLVLVYPPTQNGLHPTSLQIPPLLLRRMLLSSIWQLHQRGYFGLHEAACQLAQLPFLAATGWTADQIAHALQSRAVVEVSCFTQLLDALRDQFHLKLFCVCNASSEELARLRRQFPAVFAKFHATFASGEEGVGKPSLRFLQTALEKAGICANETLYLDSHDLETVVAARSLGMHAMRLVPTKSPTTASPEQLYLSLINNVLHDLLPPYRELHQPVKSTLPRPTTEVDSSPLLSTAGTPILSLPVPSLHRWSKTLSSARQYLLKSGPADDLNKLPIQHASLTSDGIRIHDNFAQFVIADVLNDDLFLPMQSAPVSGLICFINRAGPNRDSQNNTVTTCFNRNGNSAPFDTFKDIPEDLDTTSVGLSVLYKLGKVGMETIHGVLDKMLKYVSRDDGILQVYFDSERPRIDPVAVCNALFLFHLAKRGHEVEKSERFVESVLLHRAYEEGTLYYNLGEAFLVSVARLVHRFEEHFTRTGMRRVLVTRLEELMAAQRKDPNKATDVLGRLMRLRACALCRIPEDEDTQEGVGQEQKEDGSWDGCGYYRYGSGAQTWIGNEALTTAYAYASLLNGTL